MKIRQAEKIMARFFEDETYNPRVNTIHRAALTIIIFGPAALRFYSSKWEKEAIERGYAEYSVTTGEWQWKEKLNKQE